MIKMFFFTLLLCVLCGAEELPSVPLAQIQLPEIKLPAIQLPEINCDTAIAVAKVPVATVSVTSVADMAAVKAVREEKAKLFRDQRGLICDRTAFSGNAAFDAWLEIYRSHTPYAGHLVPLRKGLRMVAELHHPADETILNDNLKFYRSNGYDAILITFDGSEEPYHLTELADKVTAAGFKIWYAFGGAEDLALSVFIHPYRLRRLIGVLAPRAEGTLLNWRRTSQHLLLPDAAFTDFFIQEGRKSNPQLQVVGESYYGVNAQSDHKFAVASHVPVNASGVLLVNVGYAFYLPEKVFERLFPELAPIPRLVLVLGDTPYYATRNCNNMNFMQNLQIKKDVENRYLKAGAAGTVTFHGDGSNGLYNKFHTDNIGRTGRN